MSSVILFNLHLWWRIFVFFGLLMKSFGLTIDGVLLLSFKYNVLSDPLGVLQSWSYSDQTPCSWNGVFCGAPANSGDGFHVTGLSLPNSQLLGSLPADLGMIEHLRNLDLSNNSINGSIPLSIYNATELRTLDLSNNVISGELTELVGGLKSLELLNVSDNALAGKLPENLTVLRNLAVVSLKNNYFSGGLPSGFDTVKVLDLSSNLINGSLPSDFRGNNIHYLNVSFNKLSGQIPVEFANSIPINATIDLSFNNFSGEIPGTTFFQTQGRKSFAGNQELCGNPLDNLCPIPSSISTYPNATAPTSPPAIAVIPKEVDSSNSSNNSTGSQISISILSLTLRFGGCRRCSHSLSPDLAAPDLATSMEAYLSAESNVITPLIFDASNRSRSSLSMSQMFGTPLPSMEPRSIIIFHVCDYEEQEAELGWE